VRFQTAYVDDFICGPQEGKRPFDKWEEVEPTRNSLLHMMAQLIERLMEEMKGNIRILVTEITDQNVYNSVELKTDHWRSLCSTDADLRTIQWALINSENGLYSELCELYGGIDRYRRLIRDANIRKDFVAAISLEDTLKMINKTKSELLNKAQVVESHIEQARDRLFRNCG